MGAPRRVLLFGDYDITPLATFLIMLFSSLLVGVVAAFVLARSHGSKSAVRALLVGLLYGILVGATSTAWSAAGFPILTVYGYLIWSVPGFGQLYSMCVGHLRGPLWRLVVTTPGHMFGAAALFGPLTLLVAFIFNAYVPVFGALLCIVAISLISTFWNRKRDVTLSLDGTSVSRMRQVAEGPPAKGSSTGTVHEITIYQITDPHLGPFMSVDRLAGIVQSAVERAPDIIALTGDFYTVESHYEPDALKRAFAPLANFRGTAVAIHGNHDAETGRLWLMTQTELASVGVRMLVDEAITIRTRAGVRVQIVGSQFGFRGKRAHCVKVSESVPREPGAMRLCLNHDPMEFRWLPDGECDLMLAGHLHGGHIGCMTPWCTCSLFSLCTLLRIPWPASGFWAKGRNRAYIHRGTGFYGFPLRVGIPGEEGMLRVLWATDASADEGSESEPQRGAAGVHPRRGSSDSDIASDTELLTSEQ